MRRCGFPVVAEVTLEFEEWRFVEVVAEESYEDGGNEDGACGDDYAEDFGVEAVVDELTDGGRDHHDGVMEDVDAVAVFSEETHGGVFEDMLGGGCGAKCHGNERCARYADDAEPEGGDKEVVLPIEAVVEDSSAEEDCDSNGEDAGSKGEDSLPSGGSQSGAETAAVEEIVCAGERGGVREVDVAEMRGDQEDANEEDDKAD